MKKSKHGKIRGMAAGTTLVAGVASRDLGGDRKREEKREEKAFLKCGRYRLPLDKYTADLVIGVRKGTGEGCESDNQWRAGRYTSRNHRDNRQSDTDRCATRASSGSDAAGNPARASTCRDGSRSGRRHLHGVSRRRIAVPFGKRARVEAVEEFREESEKAAAQKQQRQQEQGQKKVREADTALAPFDRQKHCL